jgi:tetratricopeptide (TPR) repeat protein
LQVIDRNPELGLELAVEALALAEEIGDDLTAAICFNSIGMARVRAGDVGGVEDVVRSVERAERSGSIFHHHSALNNLANMMWNVGRLDEGSARIHEARDLCERYGFASALRWNDAELAYDANYHGDLQAALAAANEFLAHDWSELGYQLRPMLATRAFVLLSLGRLGEAVADAEQALAGVREGGSDAQVTPFVLTSAAHCFRAAGRVEEADSLLDEVMAFGADPDYYGLPLHLVEVGRGEEYLALMADAGGSLWLEAARAACSGELVRASETYGSFGARLAEAWAALLAAERGDTSRLDAALAYFEEQGATPYVQRCRALLQASA